MDIPPQRLPRCSREISQRSTESRRRSIRGQASATALSAACKKPSPLLVKGTSFLGWRRFPWRTKEPGVGDRVGAGQGPRSTRGFGGAAAKLMMETRPAVRSTLHAQTRHRPSSTSARVDGSAAGQGATDQGRSILKPTRDPVHRGALLFPSERSRAKELGRGAPQSANLHRRCRRRAPPARLDEWRRSRSSRWCTEEPGETCSSSPHPSLPSRRHQG